MKLSDYLIQLSRDDAKVPEDRVLYLYDTMNNTYYTKVIHPAHIDYDGATYVFFDLDEPYHDFDRVNVIRAWTITNVVNCMMGFNAMLENYGESEVD